jgi:hypothetical protein
MTSSRSFRLAGPSRALFGFAAGFCCLRHRRDFGFYRGDRRFRNRHFPNGRYRFLERLFSASRFLAYNRARHTSYHSAYWTTDQSS